jgi:pimeloyl-ACP methyl ester carboxylesterase
MATQSEYRIRSLRASPCRHRLLQCCLYLGIFCVAGCDALRPLQTPMPVHFYDGGPNPTGDLVIFLPGLGDDMEAFERAGFIDLLRRSSRPMDAVVADAHLGYYLDGSLLERVYEDVVLPYENAGYSRLFVVGVSLGGLGAIQLRQTLGDRIDGIVLFGPFLGEDDLIREIEDGGGVQDWRRRLVYTPERERQVWIWIDELIEPGSNRIPSAILAFGSGDKFERAGRLLARWLPDDDVFTNDGGHDWATWSLLWADVLESGRWKALGNSGQ